MSEINRYNCGVLNCGNGNCIHELLKEKCPECGRNMVRVKTTGFKFCSSPGTTYGCSYDDNSELIK